MRVCKSESQSKLIQLNHRTHPVGVVKIGEGGTNCNLQDDVLHETFNSLQLRLTTFTTIDIRTFSLTINNTSCI